MKRNRKFHFEEEQLIHLPLIASFLNCIKIQGLEKNELEERCVNIKYYQSQKVDTYPHYKPISKIVLKNGY